MAEKLSFVDSLLVTVVGIGIVFLGLLILIMLIKLLVLATENMGKAKKEKKSVQAPAPAPAAPAVETAPVAQANDDALIAVITAAVACMMEDGTAFTVRRVRRIGNAPAWQRAGRDEQIYSRL